MFFKYFLKFLIFNHFILSIYGQGLLELACASNADCVQYKLTGYNTTCLDSHCICNNLNGDSIPCEPKVSKLNNIIGGQCPCLQESSRCNEKENVCYCKADYIASMDRRRCIRRTAQLEEICENDSQCIMQDKFSECDILAKKCKCQKNFIQHEQVCMSIVGLEDSCIDSEQCQNLTANSICLKNKCVCKTGYTASLSKTKCLPAANYNENCSETSQCKLKLGVGSECYSGLCSCDYQHYYIQLKSSNENLCERRVEPGQYCTEHNQCYQYHLNTQQSMECFLGECICRPGYHLHDYACLKSDSSSNIVKVYLLILTLAFVTLIY